MPINADKPHLWKADTRASVDQFNQWFMKFGERSSKLRVINMRLFDGCKRSRASKTGLRTGNVPASTTCALCAALCNKSGTNGGWWSWVVGATGLEPEKGGSKG